MVPLPRAALLQPTFGLMKRPGRSAELRPQSGASLNHGLERVRMIFSRLVGLALIVTGLTGCGNGGSLEAIGAATAERRDLPGHVYLLRGLIGDIFSLGMDDLARKIERRGVNASVHGVSSARFLADDIISKYRRDPSVAPIMLIGHSTGGDEIIAMAERLKTANIPVALAFGFDPTPIAGDVPSNVELFINLYQATNLIGGGRATPGAGFRGRLVNVDLRERREIMHITLDKSKAIHDLVADKIIGVAEFAARAREPAASAPRAPQRRSVSPGYVTPLVMKYVVPANAQIELWDSAISIAVGADDTLETIAARTGAPAWAIAQINNLGGDSALQAGRTLLIPQSTYAPAPIEPGGLAHGVSGAARSKPIPTIR